MNEFLAAFVEAMDALRVEGLDFATEAEHSLSDILGPEAGSALLQMIGKDALKTPRNFVEEIGKFAGPGDEILCHFIGTRAIEKAPAIDLIPVKAFEAFKFVSRAPVEVKKEKRTHYFHDHRIPDDLEEYQDKLHAESESRGITSSPLTESRR